MRLVTKLCSGNEVSHSGGLGMRLVTHHVESNNNSAGFKQGVESIQYPGTIPEEGNDNCACFKEVVKTRDVTQTGAVLETQKTWGGRKEGKGEEVRGSK